MIVTPLLLMFAGVQQPPAGEGPRGTSQDFGAERYDAVGYASWYGEDTPGTTASGSRFAPSAITAAHKTLPLGSFAEVTSLVTGRTILVMITDRGPNVPGRLIDLSRGAAQMLGTDRTPVSPVRVRRVIPSAADQVALRAGRPAPERIAATPQLLAALRKRLGTQPAVAAPPASAAPRWSASPSGSRSGLFVQVAAFSTEARARALADRLGGVVQAASPVYRVRLGPFSSRGDAERAQAEAVRQGYGDAKLVQE